MRHALRRRFWFETAMAGIATLLAVVTLVRRDWIEALFALDPDRGSGALEWTIVGSLLALAIGLTLLARYEWGAARAARRDTRSRLSAEATR